jgi:hypothetical protein
MTSVLAEAIAQLGSGPYRDGSSTRAGWLYQPMGDFVPELQNVPCHWPDAVRHTFGVIRDAGGHEGTLIDVGCSTGYYLAGLSGYSLAQGYERDPAALAIARACGLNVCSEELFGLTPAEFPRPVTVLALNVHMWWVKQGVASDMMNRIANVADRCFFQTAGADSRGMFTVDFLRSAADEDRYLSWWFAHRELIDTTALHGGARRLWRLKHRP